MRVAIYARVSSSKQTVENQLVELREVAEKNRWLVVAELTDEGISGSKGRKDRPAFDKLHRLISRRQIDLVVTWSIDRLGRSITDVVGLMAEMDAKSVDLYSHQQAIDTRTPAGRMTFSIFAAIAEFEREIIRERVLAGLSRAKSRGKKLGRPSVVCDAVSAKVVSLRRSGVSLRSIADRVGVSVGTVSSIIKAAA